MTFVKYHEEFDIKWITEETTKKYSQPPLNPLLKQGGDRRVVDYR
jgi:hypothetical protein